MMVMRALIVVFWWQDATIAGAKSLPRGAVTADALLSGGDLERYRNQAGCHCGFRPRIFVLSRNSVSYSDVLFRDVLVSGSRLYSTIFRYKVPRLISSTRAASFLFQETASSTRTMCARSASRSVGSRGGPSVTGIETPA